MKVKVDEEVLVGGMFVVVEFMVFDLIGVGEEMELD